MTSAKPIHKCARLAIVGGVSALALTIAVPYPAAAAPAPCERAEGYAAQSGAQLLRVDRLEGGEVGRISNVGVVEAKSALVADATVNSAAITRLLDADMRTPYTAPLIQQAPPTNATAARRATVAGEIGPFGMKKGTLTSHARWDPRMACGRAAGEATRAEAAVRGVRIGHLMRVPQPTRSRSTTAMAAGDRTIAGAELKVPAFDLLGGAVHVKVVRPPSLSARMSTKDGGEVRYVPPVLEVSGDGVRTRRLDEPGDEFELALKGDRTESDSGSSTVDEMTGGVPLHLPTVPGLPRIGDPEKSAQAAGSGTRVRITLGDVRRATAGHAIAAKATAIRIALTEASSDDPEADGHTGTSGQSADNYSGTATDRGRVVLDLGVGLLEAAAVAPEPHTGGAKGGVQGAVSAAGAGAGLPITGSPVALVAIGGGALVLAGVAALALGTRRRRLRP
jgi:hypothetical protein